MSKYLNNGELFLITPESKYLSRVFNVGDKYMIRKTDKQILDEKIQSGYSQMQEIITLSDGSVFRYKYKCSVNMNPKSCYVYAAIRNSELLYIGKGSKGRWKHCINGRSDNRELNELAILYKDTEVYILCEDLNESTAYDIENSLICNLTPKLNKFYPASLPRCKDCGEVVVKSRLVGTQQDDFYYGRICPECALDDNDGLEYVIDDKTGNRICKVEPTHPWYNRK